MTGLEQRAKAAKVPFTTNHQGAMFGCFFTDQSEVTQFDQVMACNIEHFQKFFHGMLDNGVYLAPSAFEAGFISAAHGDAEIDRTLAAAQIAFAAVKK
jgi:glutamate-1-semialdehyde 2,1-aminomutase